MCRLSAYLPPTKELADLCKFERDTIICTISRSKIVRRNCFSDRQMDTAKAQKRFDHNPD